MEWKLKTNAKKKENQAGYTANELSLAGGQEQYVAACHCKTGAVMWLGIGKNSQKSLILVDFV